MRNGWTRCYSMVGPKKIPLTFLPFPRPLRPLYDSDVCRKCYFTQLSLLCTEEADDRYKGLTDQCGVGNGGEVGSQSWVKTYIWQSRQETFSRGDYQAFKTTFHVLKALQLIYVSSLKETQSHVFIQTTSAAVSTATVGFIGMACGFSGRLSSFLSSCRFPVNCKTFYGPPVYRKTSSFTAWHIPNFVDCH